MTTVYMSITGFIIKVLSIIAPSLVRKLCPVTIRTVYLDDPPYAIAFDDTIKPAIYRYKRLRDIDKKEPIVWVQKAQLRFFVTNNTEHEVLLHGISVDKKVIDSNLQSCLQFIQQGFKQIASFEINLDSEDVKPSRIQFVDYQRVLTEGFFKHEVLSIQAKEQEVVDLTLLSDKEFIETTIILEFLIDSKIKRKKLKKKALIVPLKKIRPNEKYWRIHSDGREFGKFDINDDLHLLDSDVTRAPWRNS